MRFTFQPFNIFFKQLSFAFGGHKLSLQLINSNCSSAAVKQTHPSADRNSSPISEAIRTQLDLKTTNLKLLEIASASGQHVGFLAPLFPNITFQPTEIDRDHFTSISAYAATCPTKNILQPLHVDISKDLKEWGEASSSFQLASFDYMFNSNMMHISPWSCSVGLFRAAGKLLKPNGMLFTYGPYAVDSVLTPESNVSFDLSLKSRNPQWGIRDIADLKKLATENGMELKLVQEMPSNNKFLTWSKQ